MFDDILAAIHAAIREYKRRRWVKQFARQADLPF